MAYEGTRKTVPSSRHMTLIDLMENGHWSYRDCVDLYENAPEDLLTELLIRQEKRAIVAHKREKKTRKALEKHGKR